MFSSSFWCTVILCIESPVCTKSCLGVWDLIHLETYGNTILVSIGRVEFVSALCSCFLFYFVLFNQEVYGRLFKTNKKVFYVAMGSLSFLLLLFILFNSIPKRPYFSFSFFFLFVVTRSWKHWFCYMSSWSTGCGGWMCGKTYILSCQGQNSLAYYSGVGFELE